MSKRIPLAITVAIVVVSIIATSLTTIFVILNQYDNIIQDLPEKAIQYSSLSEIDELVRREYYGKIELSSINKSVANGYVNGLKDSNCYYISAEDYPSYKNLIEGKIEGAGINAFYDQESGLLKISYVYADSPASKVGITDSCYIIAVDKKNITEKNSNDLLKKISEGYGTKVNLSYILSANEDISTAKHIDLTTGYTNKSCKYDIHDNIGYVHFSSFYEDTVTAFAEAIDYFNEKSVSALIIDLRNCSSFSFDIAAKIVDIIVPVGNEGSGAVYTAKNNKYEIIEQYSSSADAVNMSVAVLMNTRTSGAAELIACDLRDYGKAILFGENTAGVGTLQELFQLSDGGAVLLTVGEIFPYISDSFNEVGVKPDVEISTSDSFKNQLDFVNFENDEQYQGAYSYLTGK